MKHRIILLLTLFTALRLSAQEIVYEPHFGGHIGLAFNIGTQINRLGLSVQGYYAHRHFQVNAAAKGYYNFKSFGPKKPRPEWQLQPGVVFSYGALDSLVNPFVHPVSNQTQRKNSVAFAYNWYLENLTQQPTGTLALQFGKFEIITENDALSGEGQDKFRTGALQVAYRHQNARVALQSILWTGNTHGKEACRVKEAGDYPCRFGYKDISKAHCGKFSHGILAVQYQHHLGYRQYASASLGIDSERVRHFLQNKLIHDMPFWPEKWNKVHNPHLPMLDKEGNPYLFAEGQEVKPLRFFFDLGSNGTLFY